MKGSISPPWPACWWSWTPCPGLQGSDTRPYFSCGLHTVLLQSGCSLCASTPLTPPSLFKRKRHAWFHTWKIFVIGQQGLWNTFKILNRIRPVPSVSPPFLPEEMYLHLFKRKRFKKNGQNTGYRSCYMLHISQGFSKCRNLCQNTSQFLFISVWLMHFCCILQRNTEKSVMYCNIYLAPVRRK